MPDDANADGAPVGDMAAEEPMPAPAAVPTRADPAQTPWAPGQAFPPLPSDPPTSLPAPGLPGAVPSGGSPPPPPSTWNAPPPPGGPSTGRTKQIAVVVGLAVLLLAGIAITLIVTSGPKSAAPNSPAARRLVRAALKATIHGGSFHYVSRFTSGGQTQTTVGDAGPTSGRQVITIGSDTFTVLVIGTACYFQGDERQMVEQLGLPTSVASAHAGQWISLAPGDLPYQSVYVAVTARSALSSNIAFAPHQEVGISTKNGLRVLGIAGSMTNQTVSGQLELAKGKAMLYITTSRPHLPVQYTENGKVGTSASNLAPSKLVMTFTKWGETVDPTAPRGAVSYASLGVGNGTVPTTGPPVLTSTSA